MLFSCIDWIHFKIKTVFVPELRHNNDFFTTKCLPSVYCKDQLFIWLCSCCHGITVPRVSSHHRDWCTHDPQPPACWNLVKRNKEKNLVLLFSAVDLARIKPRFFMIPFGPTHVFGWIACSPLLHSIAAARRQIMEFSTDWWIEPWMATCDDTIEDQLN